jgi:hypothetical protein
MYFSRLSRIFGGQDHDDRPLRHGFGRNLIRAFAEVLLIVLGILIALYVDDWNESRKQALHFQDSMERVYNSVMDDLGLIERQNRSIVQQLEIIETLLNDPEAIDDQRLLHKLYFLDYPRAVWAETAWSAVRQDPATLETDASDKAQLNLVEQLADYLDNMAHDEAALSFGTETTRDLISPVLRGAGIPDPAHLFGTRENNDFLLADFNFFTESEINLARDLLRNGSLSEPLRSSWARKAEYQLLAQRRRDLAQSVIASIKTVYPDVQLRFGEISITGPALNKEAAVAWDDLLKSECDPGSCVADWIRGYELWTDFETTMSRSDESALVWELETQLWDGMVKFRSRGSWDENWGGKTFPSGEAVRHGDNIPVDAGNYRIVLDLERLEYRFIKLE